MGALAGHGGKRAVEVGGEFGRHELKLQSQRLRRDLGLPQHAVHRPLAIGGGMPEGGDARESGHGALE